MSSRLFLAMLSLAACTSFEGADPSTGPDLAGNSGQGGTGGTEQSAGQAGAGAGLGGEAGAGGETAAGGKAGTGGEAGAGGEAAGTAGAGGEAAGTAGAGGEAAGAAGAGGEAAGAAGAGGEAAGAGGEAAGAAGAGGEAAGAAGAAGAGGAGAGSSGSSGQAGGGGGEQDPCTEPGALAGNARWATEGGTLARCNRSVLEGPGSEKTSLVHELGIINKSKKFGPQFVVDEQGTPHFQQGTSVYALRRDGDGPGEVINVYLGTSASLSSLLLLPDQQALRVFVGSDLKIAGFTPMGRQEEPWIKGEVKSLTTTTTIGHTALTMRGSDEVLLSVNGTIHSFQLSTLKQNPAFATGVSRMLPAHDPLKERTYFCKKDGNKLLLVHRSAGPELKQVDLSESSVDTCHVAVGPQGRAYVTAGNSAWSLDPSNFEFDFSKASTVLGATALPPAIRNDGSAAVVFNQSGPPSVWSVSKDMKLLWKTELDGVEQVLAPPLLDAQGNLYLCTTQEVLSFSPQGEPRWSRPHEETPVQCALGLSAPGRLDVLTDRRWLRVEGP